MSPSDVEAARVRARRRLIGMAVLVGAGVIGFPWLFETQPRPMSQDVEMVHAAAAGSDEGLTVARGASGRVAVAGIVPPAAEREASATPRQGREGNREQERQQDRAAEPAPVARESMSSKPPGSTAAGDKPADKPANKPADQDRPAAKAAPKPADKPAEKPPAERPKAPAKTAEKTPDKDKPADKAANRYVVQFGAFADAAAARAARMKVEKLGIKTYAQQVNTPAGKRIRVRIGPYADKAEADKALAALKKAGLAGAVLTL